MYQKKYWTCFGKDVLEVKKKPWWKFWGKPKKKKEPYWRYFFTTREEAEYSAASPLEPIWEWSGKKAERTSIGIMLRGARETQDYGIILYTYKDEKWVEVKKWCSDQLLTEEGCKI